MATMQSSFSLSIVGPVGSTVLGSAAAALSPGQSVDLLGLGTPVPLHSLTRAECAWQSHGDYDPINQQCAFWGKAAGGTSGYQLEKYDIASNTWTKVWEDLFANNGHIYSHNSINPLTGELYFQKYQFPEAYRISTGNVTTRLPDHTFSYQGVYADCSGYHPNLYGPNDGGYVHFMYGRIIAYRDSTNSWALLSERDNVTTTALGSATWLASTDALIQTGDLPNGGWRITPNPTVGNAPVVTQIAGCPEQIRAGSPNTSSALLRHPRNSSKLLALIGATQNCYEFDGTNWSDAGYNHPFAPVGSSQGYAMCAIPELDVVWKLDADSSILWKPDST